MENIDSGQLDNIGKQGTEHSTEALSRLLGKEIEMSGTETAVISPEDLINAEFPTNETLTVVHMGVEGDVSGESFFLLHGKSAQTLASLLNTDKEDETAFTEDDKSMFKEVGNIFVGAYLNALSDAVELSLLPKIPELKISEVDNVKNELLEKLNLNPVSETITIKTSVKIKEVEIFITFFVLFTQDSINKIMEKLK